MNYFQLLFVLVLVNSLFGVKIFNHFFLFTSCISTNFSSSLSTDGMHGILLISFLSFSIPLPPSSFLSSSNVLSFSKNYPFELKLLALFLIAIFLFLFFSNLLNLFAYISRSILYNLEASSNFTFWYFMCSLVGLIPIFFFKKKKL